MPARIRHNPAAVRRPKSLAVRGGLARTFGGLVSFLAVTFLCSGIYILEDAFANPLAAQAAALIAAAFIIALATILLFYLIKPARRTGMTALKRSHAAVSLSKHEFFDEIPRNGAGGHDLVYQRVYVDRSRIRP